MSKPVIGCQSEVLQDPARWGKRITRREAIALSAKTLRDAEAERLRLAEEEAWGSALVCRRGEVQLAYATIERKGDIIMVRIPICDAPVAETQQDMTATVNLDVDAKGKLVGIEVICGMAKETKDRDD